MANRTMNKAEWVLLAVLSMCWGASFFFIELALEGMPPFTLVFFRVALAATIMWVIVLLGGGTVPKSGRLWGIFFVLGLIGIVMPFSLISWGQVHIDSGLASILNAMMPLFTVLLAHWFTADEKLTPRNTLGVLIGLGAVALIVGPDAWRGVGGYVLGQLAVVGGAVAYAAAAIYGRRLHAVPVRIVTAGVLSAASLWMLPTAMIVDRPWNLAPGLGAVAGLVALAVISTAGAFLIYYHILERAGATNVSLVTFLIPVSALFLGITFLGERPDWSAYAGLALIFAGLTIIDGRPISWAQQRIKMALG